MNKMRIVSESEYIIEVNDDGETISFNPDDPTLALRMEKAFEDVSKALDNLKAKILIIEKKENIPPQKGQLIDSKTRETLKVYDASYKNMRKAMDGFLGKGACQKIFGDKNYLSMFNDLFKALEPHFAELGLKGSSFYDAIKEKYGNEDDGETLEA